MLKILFIFLLFFINIISFAQLPDKPDGTLPVEIIYFYGIDSNETSSIVLYWGTATEVNCYGFDIERSMDSTNWIWIGFVQGNGNSNSPKDYNFKDSTVTDSGIYYYRLKQIDTDGAFEYYNVVINFQITDVEMHLKNYSDFMLYQNYPNPFNPVTIITFELAEEKEVSLDLFDSSGKLIANILSGRKTAGKYSLFFNGNYLSSGVYFYRLFSGSLSITKKLVLLK